MVNLDQMIDAWRAQDEKPLYGVNRDLLQLVVRHEEADLRKSLRWEQWTTYLAGIGMTALAGAILWWFLDRRGPDVYTAAAAIGVVACALWVGALWLSRRRQAVRERDFGNTLQAEIGRNLSLIDYRLSRIGSLSRAMLWTAPALLGSVLIYWLLAEINDNSSFFYDASMIAFIVVSMAWGALDMSRTAKRELEPRRERLSALLDLLNAS